jgi:hypothetical protein
VDISSGVHIPFSVGYFLVINKKPLFPSNADFNQISSVWAKGRYWQDIFILWMLMPPTIHGVHLLAYIAYLGTFAGAQ